MVSRGDGEESSYASSGGADSLNTMYDSDYCGLADGQEPVHCSCRAVAKKFVCFEGCYTGRRFLGCVEQEGGETCDFVHWVDAKWPSPLQKAVCKLWDNYGEEKQGRVNDALDFLEQKFKLQDEIKKLNHDLKMVQNEVEKVVEKKQITLALKARAEQALIDARSELEQKKKLDDSSTNMQKAMRIKAEQDYCKIKEEKKKLEYTISDLLKQKEGTRAKLRKIKEMCEE
ncbi:unnamed protein product [Alopecurus aequalis]